MTAINGQGGAVKIAAVILANLDTWDISTDAGVVDITTFQSPGGWKTFISTVKGWSGKASGRFDGADATGQVTLINGIGGQFAMSFMTDAVHSFGGNALLTKIVPKADASGLVSIEFDFTGNGACTFV